MTAIIRTTFFALTLFPCLCSSVLADISQWVGIYRGVGVIEQTDGKRNEIHCELHIIEDNSQDFPEVLTIKYSQDLAIIQIRNLGSAPKHLTVQMTDNALSIAPLFAYPISIKLQKDPGGFNETLLVGDLVEYTVSYAQEPKTDSTLHLKLGKLQ